MAYLQGIQQTQVGPVLIAHALMAHVLFKNPEPSLKVPAWTSRGTSTTSGKFTFTTSLPLTSPPPPRAPPPQAHSNERVEKPRDCDGGQELDGELDSEQKLEVDVDGWLEVNGTQLQVVTSIRWTE